MVAYLQAGWRENLGIEIAWQVKKGLGIRLERGEPPHVFTSGSVSTLDPDGFLRAFLRPFSAWQNKDYSAVVEKARRVMDPGERIRLYGQADRILVEEAPFVPLAYDRSHWLVKPWVTAFPFSALGYLISKDAIIEPH